MRLCNLRCTCLCFEIFSETQNTLRSPPCPAVYLVLHLVLLFHTETFSSIFLANVYEATDCEGSRVLLECPTGQSVRVLSVFFGREDNTTCGGDEAFTDSCSASNPLSVVRPQCDGRNTCPIYATQLLFGNPCDGVQMYLKVRFMCAGKCKVVFESFSVDSWFIRWCLRL